MGGDFLVIIQGACVHDYLEVAEAGTVVKFDEAEGFHVADGAGPAADGDGLAVELWAIGEERGDFDSFHMISPAIS